MRQFQPGLSRSQSASRRREALRPVPKDAMGPSRGRRDIPAGVQRARQQGLMPAAQLIGSWQADPSDAVGPRLGLRAVYGSDGEVAEGPGKG